MSKLKIDTSKMKQALKEKKKFLLIGVVIVIILALVLNSNSGEHTEKEVKKEPPKTNSSVDEILYGKKESVWDDTVKCYYLFELKDKVPKLSAIQPARPYIWYYGPDSVKLYSTELNKSISGVRSREAEVQLPTDVDSSMHVFMVQFSDPFSYPSFEKVRMWERRGEIVAIHRGNKLYSISDELDILLTKAKPIRDVPGNNLRPTKTIRVRRGWTVSYIAKMNGMTEQEFYNLNKDVDYYGLKAGQNVKVYK